MRLIGVLLLLICGGVFAQGVSGVPFTNALSFAPPATDVSLSFLGNIFGVVDGVLAGYGSQIFGRMMNVFNSAVLALGSIISTYVLILGTMHTAHEGEFLGKKWSSILIPIRTTVGLGLLIPKASGYCLIQVFFMWVVIQGVGAADKVWNAALLYLSEGGQIIKTQPGSGQFVGGNSPYSKRSDVYTAGIKVLSGQVCMYTIEQILKKARLQLQQKPDTSRLSPEMKEFMNSTIPDFLGSVNAINFEQNSVNLNSFSLPMPNFPDTVQPNFYAKLNGICGMIKWQKFNPNPTSNKEALNFLSSSDLSAMGNTRAIAVQTMYNFLSNVAMTIVNNNPYFGNSNAEPASPTSIVQFGVPNDNGNIMSCQVLQSSSNSTGRDICSSWGPALGGESLPVLFTGNEFINAIKAYMAVMAPALNLKSQLLSGANLNATRGFISITEQNGWMFAGAYFFDLIALSGNPQEDSSTLIDDPNSGIADTTDLFDVNTNRITASCNPNSEVGSVCWFLENQPGRQLQDLLAMIRGGDSTGGGCQTVLSISDKQWTPSIGQAYIVPAKSFSTVACSSTVYGLVGNSFFYDIPAQVSKISFQIPPFSVPPVNITPFYFPLDYADCSGAFCFASDLTNLLIYYFVFFINLFQQFIDPLLTVVVNMLLVNPLQNQVWPMIYNGITTLNQLSYNPVVDLANMGAYYIQTTIDTYLSLLGIAGIGAVFTSLGVAINLMLSMMMPFLTAWLSYFTMIGMSTAYYVPMMPYMIFLFGALSWLFAVIEAMIAAPLVALIVTTPEGEGVIGKGEQGLMILLNVFLRPSLMVIGFISGTALTYASVWMLSMSFSTAAGYMIELEAVTINQDQACMDGPCVTLNPGETVITSSGMGSGAGLAAGLNWQNSNFVIMLGSVFYIVIYVSIYLILVQKSFTLIFSIPDKVLRWIGGAPESYGQDIQQWVEGTQKKVEEMAQKTETAIVQGPAELQKAAKEVSSKIKSALQEDGGAEGGAKGQAKSSGGGGGLPEG